MGVSKELIPGTQNDLSQVHILPPPPSLGPMRCLPSPRLSPALWRVLRPTARIGGLWLEYDLLVLLSSSMLSPFMASVACRVKIRACNPALRALCGCEPAHLSHLSPLMLPFLHELNHCTFSAPPWHVAVVHAVSCFSYNQCCYLHSSVLVSSTPPPAPGPYRVLFPLPGILCMPHLAYDPPLSLLQGALPDS